MNELEVESSSKTCWWLHRRKNILQYGSLTFFDNIIVQQVQKLLRNAVQSDWRSALSARCCTRFVDFSPETFQQEGSARSWPPTQRWTLIQWHFFVIATALIGRLSNLVSSSLWTTVSTLAATCSLPSFHAPFKAEIGKLGVTFWVTISDKMSRQVCCAASEFRIGDMTLGCQASPRSSEGIERHFVVVATP